MPGHGGNNSWLGAAAAGDDSRDIGSIHDARYLQMG